MLKETFNVFSKNYHDLVEFLSKLLTSGADLKSHIHEMRTKTKLWFEDLNDIKTHFLTLSPSYNELEEVAGNRIFVPFLAGNPAWENPERITTLIASLRTTFYLLQNIVAGVIKSLDLRYLKEQLEVHNSLNKPQEPASAVPKPPGSFFPK
jgi:hypothetical protein